MLAASCLSRASIAFHLAFIKNTLGLRRAGRLITAIPIWFPPHITLLFGILSLVLALVEAIETLVKL